MEATSGWVSRVGIALGVRTGLAWAWGEPHWERGEVVQLPWNGETRAVAADRGAVWPLPEGELACAYASGSSYQTAAQMGLRRRSPYIITYMLAVMQSQNPYSICATFVLCSHPQEQTAFVDTISESLCVVRGHKNLQG